MSLITVESVSYVVLLVMNECDGTISMGNSTAVVNFPCDQVCIDTCESYECTCMPGYILQEDGQHCKGKR